MWCSYLNDKFVYLAQPFRHKTFTQDLIYVLKISLQILVPRNLTHIDKTIVCADLPLDIK